MKKTIGGFLELDLLGQCEYHKSLIKINSGRNSLKLLLTERKYKKIYLPYFTCDAVTQVIDELNIEREFFTINSNFLPNFAFEQLNNDELFIINNYWGLLDEEINKILPSIKNCLVDNAQAFYHITPDKTSTIYSPRKFFGVADGGYLKSISPIINVPSEHQEAQYDHLVQRIERGSEESYKYYIENEKNLSQFSLKKMSKLSERILGSLDYELIRRKRRGNYDYLYDSLKEFNEIDLPLNTTSVPLAYPLLLKNGNQLRRLLINNKIFTPTYWPNVLEWVEKTTFEFNLANNIVNIPIDQRYGRNEMDYIISFILKFKEENE